VRADARADDAALIELLATIDHPATRAAVTAERSLLAALEAGCSAPVGGYAVLAGGERLSLRGVVLGVPSASLQAAGLDAGPVDGKIVVRERGEANAADADRLGRELAARMLSLGAAELISPRGTTPYSARPAARPVED
jgi:hydroxymethylbilane synthase